MQTIDDLDLLRYVAGGAGDGDGDGDGGDGDGDGDGGDGDGDGGDGDGDGDAAAEAGVCTAATSLSDSGINSAQNTAIAQAATDGHLASEVATFAQVSQAVSPVGTAMSTGYQDAMNGLSFGQAEAADSAAYAGAPLGFAAGYVVGRATRAKGGSSGGGQGG